MGSVTDFKFDNMSRIGSDACNLSQGDLQNSKANNYLLTNHFAGDSNMSKSIAFATSHPNVNYKGAQQVSIGGTNIDTSSKLLVQQKSTNEAERINLMERPFLTVPYVGRGKVNTDDESKILQGEYYTNKKSSNLASEVSYMPYLNTPLLGSIEQGIANPANFVEDNSDGFLRGAVGTRDVNRDVMKK
jgi:hypothetical protein